MAPRSSSISGEKYPFLELAFNLLLLTDFAELAYFPRKSGIEVIRARNSCSVLYTTLITRGRAFRCATWDEEFSLAHFSALAAELENREPFRTPASGVPTPVHGFPPPILIVETGSFSQEIPPRKRISLVSSRPSRPTPACRTALATHFVSQALHLTTGRFVSESTLRRCFRPPMALTIVN